MAKKIFKHLNSFADRYIPGWRPPKEKPARPKRRPGKRQPGKSRRRGYAGRGRIPRSPWRVVS